MGKFEWTAHAKDQRVWDAINWAKGQASFVSWTTHFDFAWVRIEAEVESFAGLEAIEQLCGILRGQAA